MAMKIQPTKANVRIKDAVALTIAERGRRRIYAARAPRAIRRLAAGMDREPNRASLILVGAVVRVKRRLAAAMGCRCASSPMTVAVALDRRETLQAILGHHCILGRVMPRLAVLLHSPPPVRVTRQYAARSPCPS
jgi:hypothetical protein